MTAPGWKRPVRLDSIGYTVERITAVFVHNREEPIWRQPPPVKRKYPLDDLLKKLDFDIGHRRDGVEVFIEAMFYVMILLLKMARESAIRSAELRNEARNLDSMWRTTTFCGQTDCTPSRTWNIMQTKQKARSPRLKRSGTRSATEYAARSPRRTKRRTKHGAGK